MQGDFVGRTIHYILERQCRSGGFCFYRLEEPNGADTYFALATLHLLGKKIDDSRTLQFLKNAQGSNGSYHNPYQAYYAFKGLKYLGSRPRHNPRPYLRDQLQHFTAKNSTSETALKRLDYLTDLCKELNIVIPPRPLENIVDFIMGCRNEDGGFGKPASTLLSSAYATRILKRLATSTDSSGVLKFLKSCENSVHGFLNVPDMAPSFLEHIHAGLTISRLLEYLPRHLDACYQFIVGCQDPNGGFARISHGLPSLADTFLAIHSLTILDALGETFHLS